MDTTANTKRLTTSALLIALATVLAIVCEFIPFLNLPFGGGFTIASMLPIVIIAYMYGTKWGLMSAFVYSLIQLIMGITLGGRVVVAFFTPGGDSYMGIGAGIGICLLDYIAAYSVLGFGGIFRKMKSKTGALVLGTVVALLFRYIVHIISGTIFFGIWAEWFFSQEGFYSFGSYILSHFSGFGLSLIYSVIYNGLYMLPEIVITAIAAALVSPIKNIERH